MTYPVQQKLTEARSLFLRRQYADADHVLAEILNSDPTCSDAWANRGALAAQRNDLELAETCLRTAIESLHRRDPKLLRTLADVLYTQNRSAEALPLYEECLRPGLVDAKLLLRCAECSYAVGRCENALQYLQPLLSKRADRSDSFAARVLQLAGSVSAHSGKFRDAENYLRRAMTIAPTSSVVAGALGMVLEASGRYDEANGVYEAHLSHRPDNVEILDKAGLVDFIFRDGAPDCLVRAARLRGLPDYQGARTTFPGTDSAHAPIAIYTSPSVSDQFGAMRIGARTLAFGLAAAGYRPRIVHDQSSIPDAKIVISLGNTSDTALAGERQNFVQVCAGPPYSRGTADLISRSRVLTVRSWTIAQVDRDTIGFAERLSARDVVPFPSMYCPDLLDASRASRRLRSRPILILYAGSNKPPEQFRSMWRSRAALARLGDALIESCSTDFTVPLPDRAAAIIADLGIELDVASPEICDLMHSVGKYLWAKHKQDVLRVLARFPCHLFLSDSNEPLQCHPKSKVLVKIPSPIYQDMMHESRAVVATLPSYVTGGLTERVSDPLVRGAVTIAVRNNGLVRSGLVPGRDVLGFGLDYGELEQHLERVMAGDPELQDIADAGRAAGLARFDPGQQMAEFMVSLESLWKEVP